VDANDISAYRRFGVSACRRVGVKARSEKHTRRMLAKMSQTPMVKSLCFLRDLLFDPSRKLVAP
jgi:hypothetical protein